MIIDSKYHAASLVAVFLALGVGIIIGSVMVGETLVENIVHEQEGIIQRLELDYISLKEEAKLSREEIVSLNRTIKYYQDYTQKMLPQLVKGKLTGRKVAIVEAGTIKTPDIFLSTLRIADAQILSVYSLESFNDLKKPEIVELAAFFNCPQDNEGVKEVLLSQLARLLETGDDTGLGQIIERFKFSRLKGKQGSSVDTVIILKDKDQTRTGKGMEVDTGFIARLQEKGIKVVHVDYPLEFIPEQIDFILSLAADGLVPPGDE